MTKMNDVAKEYGTALFSLAMEENTKEEYFQALKTVKSLFDENEEYLDMLSSPALSAGARLSVLDQAFEKILPEHVLSFLKLLCEKGRISQFNEAVDEYFELYNASEKIVDAKITSAQSLSDDEKSRLIAKLEKTHSCKINPEYITDTSLIGGITVEIDGKILDGSIRQRLREVKEVMNS